jgi:hypothetical protein
MALILADRVRETSTTTGTGALSLAGAVVGYQTFSSAIGNTNTCYYAISNPGVAEWEVGIGTYATSGNTLTRTTILKSSNANAAVNFSAGTKDVFVTYPATKSVYQDASGNVTIAGGLGVGGSAAPGSTGLAVTGTLSATLDATIYGVTVGRGAGAVATNTAVGGGSAALGQNSTGTYNAGFGYNAGYTNLTGSYNSYFGAQAGNGNVGSQSYSTGLGAYALSGISTGAYNTAVGAYALQANTTASNNTAVGYQAGYNNTTGSAVTALGYQAAYTNTTGQITAVGAGALRLNTTANDNTALGVNTLYNNSTGSANTGIGAGSLLNNTTGSENTAVGYQALYTNTTVSDLCAVGYQALYSNTTGGNNTAVGGYRTLYSNTTGSANTAIGLQALSSNTTASNNTAVGYQAGYANTTGTEYALIGRSSGYSATTADYLTALGSQAGYSTTTGVSNTFVGAASAYFNTTGAYNTAVGKEALRSNTTASNNVAVGYQAGYSNTTGTANVFLGQGTGYTNLTGISNCHIGTYAGRLSTGSYNTFIGSGQQGVADASGGQMTTGSYNTILGLYSGNQGGLDIRTASNYIVLSDGAGNPRGVFDSSGNFGLGVTPSAWNSGYSALQIKDNAIVSGVAALTSIANAYIDSASAYRYTYAYAYASLYEQSNGVHTWKTTTSTQGLNNVITWNTAMTLNSSGNLGIGTTSPTVALDVYKTAYPEIRTRSASYTNTFGIDTASGYGVLGSVSNNPFVFVTNNTERARIDLSGNLLVGCTALGAASGFGVGPNSGSSFIDICHVTATPSGSSYARFFYNSSPIGSITQSGTTAVLYNTTSDQRLKENIVDADSASSLIDSLQVRKFDWKSDNSHQRYGFVAQELVTVAPEAVHQPNDPDEMMAVDYSKLVPMLVKEIQSLRKRITALEALRA